MNRREFIGGATGLGWALAFPVGRPRRLVASQVPSNIVDFSASQLSAAIRQRQVRCLEVMQGVSGAHPPIQPGLQCHRQHGRRRCAAQPGGGRRSGSGARRVLGLDARHASCREGPGECSGFSNESGLSHLRGQSRRNRQFHDRQDPQCRVRSSLGKTNRARVRYGVPDIQCGIWCHR